MRNVYTKKFIILIIFGLFICLCFFHSCSSVDVDYIISTREKYEGRACNIIIDDSYGVFDSATDSFYYSLGSSHGNRVSRFKLKSNLNMKYKILDAEIYNYQNGRILVYNDDYYQIVNINFISIPIVSLYDSIDSIGTNKILTGIDYLDWDLTDSGEDKNALITVNYGNKDKVYNTTGDYHVRGVMSQVFDKKSYKVNMNKSFNLFNGEGYDEFVLDALYCDSSKIRNKFSSDLWNLINDDQVYDNDLYTEFVEVYINDEYKGLYVLKNSVDKDFLKVEKDGLVAKPRFDFSDDLYKVLAGDSYYTNSRMVLNYELKYYDDLQKASNTFLSKIRYIYRSGFSADSINETFYLDNYINYKLLIILNMGVDNVYRNNYVSMKYYGDKLYITPWDMDLTFGNGWSQSSYNLSAFIFDSYKNVAWINWILETDSDDIKSLIALKYKYLRDTKLTYATIDEMLDSYKYYLVENHAVERDSNLWYHYDVELEIEAIRRWMYMRIATLDEYFLGE